MPNDRVNEWISQCQDIGGYWYAKRLSGNDTQATGSHQAGPYIPNSTAFQIFPSLHDPDSVNPRISFPIVAESHTHSAQGNIIWYNNGLRGGTRNETRVTGLGGVLSPLLDPENTGAIALLFFSESNADIGCRYWVCRDIVEEAIAETFFGPIDPGIPVFRTAISTVDLAMNTTPFQEICWLTREQVKSEWPDRFPAPAEVLQKAVSLQGYEQLSVDSRLLKRRDCEYSVFQSIEDAFEMPAIQKGFNSIEEFVARANTILQRRKARSGRSLELHVKAILEEENIKFAYQAHTESNNRPDFIFPSQYAYSNSGHPDNNLRMLAVKTTVRERWRQILEEAERIDNKHLLTLQEGVSENQFAQMQDAGIRLVVPKALHSKYPSSIRSKLLTLQNLISEVGSL